ncbi:cell cycle regulator of non-homologous end joining isoform X2 [Tupaia chinensis]|nr:cell cycle regulator of non-homologous end joining isoform X2 [Tupaia chinensis]
MNEAEMVDVALGVLIEVQKQEESRKQLSLAGTKKPRLSPPCSMSPHTSSGDEEEDSEKDAPSPGLGPSQGPGGSDSAHNTSPKEEEDVLKYVREIFFS